MLWPSQICSHAVLCVLRHLQIAAEKWIVKMVSDAQLNAKIDSQSGHVILGVQPPDVYQQVIEKTKGLSFRSYVLAQNIEKRNLQATA